jgi:mannose-6-phosphate isomerase-like protein (cupin superfamily)
VFYVLEGEGIVEIGKEIETVNKDQLIFSPAKVPHLLKNESGEKFRFLVIKTPTPTSQTQML